MGWAGGGKMLFEKQNPSRVHLGGNAMVTRSRFLSKLYKKQQFGCFVIIFLLAMFIPVDVRGEHIAFDNNWGNPGFNLIHQDASGVEIVFSVSSLNIEELTINDEWMHKVKIPGVMLSGNAGAPDLSGMGRYVAMPRGAVTELEILDYQTYFLYDMNINPAPTIQMDDDGSEPLYNKNLDIYNRDEYYPAEVVTLGKSGKMRGVDFVAMHVTPFRYNPISQKLLVYTDIRFKVHFRGGNGIFGEDRLRNCWWEPVLRQNLLNYTSLPEVNFSYPKTQTDEDNVEYLIIVPDEPWFIAWADSIKRWRNEQGILTGITTIAEIGGNDATMIENYINNAYYSWEIPPVAVLLLSDYQNSGGDQYGITSPFYNTWPGGFVSDNIFADIEGDDLPDLAIGRITAQHAAHLQTMITKMLDYERNPETDPGFYQHPVIAGGWSVSQWYILCCEIIWGYMHHVLGKDPVREYAICPGSTSPGVVWSTNVNTPFLVNYFGPGGLGYIPEDPTYLYDWSSNATRINNSINDGAFFVMHRDHGYWFGWDTPSYTITDLGGLANASFPYLYCLSSYTGHFNNVEECFAEAIHRMPYGMVGVTAPTGPTYSFVSETYLFGVFDYMFPDFDPGYGEPGPPDLRPGFANASGKYYLFVSSWPWSGYKVDTYHTFHHHGDVFMIIYSEIPQTLTVDHPDSIEEGATEFWVSADEGSLICLSIDGNIVGLAEGTGAAVTIPLVEPASGDVMKVTATKTNYFRYIADLPIVPGGATDLQITLTPYNPPIQIPLTGGSFEYNIEVANSGAAGIQADVWCDVTLPSGSQYGPTLGPVNFYFDPGFSGDRDRSQNVPGGAPTGTYTYNGYVGSYPSVVWDSDFFPLKKRVATKVVLLDRYQIGHVPEKALKNGKASQRLNTPPILP